MTREELMERAHGGRIRITDEDIDSAAISMVEREVLIEVMDHAGYTHDRDKGIWIPRPKRWG